MLENITSETEMAIAIYAAQAIIHRVITEGDGSGYNIPEEYKSETRFANLVSALVRQEMTDPTKWEATP